MYAYDSTYFYYCFADYDGSSIIWAQVTQIGNVSISSIQNGNSTVSIASNNGNATISIGGSSNVAVFATTGQFVTGRISASGNITGDYILGNGSQLTGLPALYGNSDVAAYLPTYSGNLQSLNGPVTTSGTVTGGIILTAGYVSAVGNITGDYIYGNGAFLTGITGGGGGGGNGTAIVNGLTTVDIPVSSGNIKIDVGFAANIVVISNDGLTVTGNVLGNNLLSTGTVSATGNIDGGNITTAGQISVAGNVSSSYFIGDGSLLTNVGGGGNYGNADVASFLTTYSGNLSAGNVSFAGQANVTGNVNVNYQSRINGTVNGQLYGLTNGVNTAYGTWDFGFIAANTYDNPIQWIFALTSAGNVDMGTVTAPASLDIDIGTIF
jgi:hypothetical protein